LYKSNKCSIILVDYQTYIRYENGDPVEEEGVEVL
jgi:hypothetical protein